MASFMEVQIRYKRGTYVYITSTFDGEDEDGPMDSILHYVLGCIL